MRIALVLCSLLAIVSACSTGDDPGVPPTTTATPVTEGQVAPPVPDATIVEEGTSATVSSPTETSATEQNVYIDNVEAANPVVIRGRARTFENNVALRVRDANGGIIGESFTTATGEMGTHSPFEGEVWVTRDPGGRITAEALEYSAKDGSPRSLVTKSIHYPVELIDATLHFPDKTCTTTKPFIRRVPKTVSMARLLVEALIAGPGAAERAAGAAAPFPSGSAVRSVNLKGGTLTVDFNERLQNVGGSCYAQMIRAAVTQTLKTLPTVKKVVITAGGSEKLALQP